MTVKRTTRWGAGATALAASTLTLGFLASPATADTNADAGSADNRVAEPEEFTSAFIAEATPEQVVPNDAGPGQVEGASGTFVFGIDSVNEVICWDIVVTGLSTDYQSLAKTSTHIHENVAGQNGPPRIAFPNPGPVSDDPDAERTSSGCAEGPLTTGLTPVGGPVTGAGFELAQLEEDLEAEAFSADTHTTDAVPGAIRGQLVFSQEILDALNEGDDAPGAPGDGDDAADEESERRVPIGGVRTGDGGSASALPLGLMAAFTIGAAGAAGAVALRRRHSA